MRALFVVTLLLALAQVTDGRTLARAGAAARSGAAKRGGAARYDRFQMMLPATTGPESASKASDKVRKTEKATEDEATETISPWSNEAARFFLFTSY